MKRLLFALLFAVPVTALADQEQRGFYLGAEFGLSDADRSVDFTVRDDDHASYRFRAGYTFNQYLGAEIGYVDIGDFHWQIPSIEGAIDDRIDLDGFTLGLRPKIDLGNSWFAQAQLGAFFWDAETTLKGPILIDTRNTFDDEDAYYGLGIGRRFGANWNLSADWTRYETRNNDVDLLSLSVGYRFGS